MLQNVVKPCFRFRWAVNNHWSLLKGLNVSLVVYDSIKSMLLTAQVCKAITELSSTLGDLENTFTRKMEQFLQERPELNNHVTGLKEDIADLIKVLSEKLTGEGDAEAAIDEEVSTSLLLFLIKDTRL